MSAAIASNAILQFVSNNAYPEDESVVTAELTPTVLTTILEDLRKQRDQVKQEIRALSKTNGPNVESWIDQAKSLQQGIQQSRDVARQIVEQHNAGDKLKAEVDDAKNKISLLERELLFEASLRTTLQQVKEVHGLLLDAQDAIVEHQFQRAYEVLGSVKASITRLGSLKDTRCVVVLRERGQRLESNLVEAVTGQWQAMLAIDTKQHVLTIRDEQATDQALQTIAQLAQDLSVIDDLALKLCRDIERALLKPLLSKPGSGQTLAAMQKGRQICLEPRTKETKSLFSDVRIILSYLAQHLPENVLRLVLDHLMPRLLPQIEEVWLEPLIPAHISQILGFETTISDVTDFAEYLDQNHYGNTKTLHDWLASLPKTWITRRREVLLGEVRNIVFQRVHEKKSVERIETQTIAGDNAATQQAKATSGDDDWDNAWDDENTEKATHSPVDTSKAEPLATTAQDEDDASAWDVDGEAVDTSEETSAWDDQPDAAGGKPRDADGEDAWGWGEDANETEPKNTASASVPTKPVTSAQQQELTFREVYTVTAIPDQVLEVVQTVISDAQELATEKYDESTIASAAAGLYSLPTLALAIYRATAPTAYAKLPSANMLIYNDATRLSERLREWQASQPPASRLRLDSDANALDMFARRAYSTEMELQKMILRDLLDGAQGFGNCTVSPFKQACEGAVEQTADRLQDLHREWKDVLGHNALLQSLGQLLSGVTGRMIADVEDLSDIGEADSQELKRLCERLSVVKALFAQQQSDGELRDMTFVYCPNWLKFQYLAEILESSLADIKFLWNEGELSLEFSSEEVVDLVKALFAESDYRRKLIADLRRHSTR